MDTFNSGQCTYAAILSISRCLQFPSKIRFSPLGPTPSCISYIHLLSCDNIQSLMHDKFLSQKLMNTVQVPHTLTLHFCCKTQTEIVQKEEKVN